jgi:hypothetical protein
MIKETLFATVALPLYNMGQIVELTLEGLSKQKTSYKWELIVCEENNGNHYGHEKLLKWEDNLKFVGCERIIYIPLQEWIPLGQKWKILAEAASSTHCFILQAGDCHPHSLRIQETCEAFEKENCNYYDEQQGYFYSYKYNKTILFNPDNTYTHNCRLNMAWETNLFKRLPNNDRKRIVDSFLYAQLNKIETIKKYRNFDLHEDGVDVDGYNMISSRDGFFIKENYNYIFKKVKHESR